MANMLIYNGTLIDGNGGEPLSHAAVLLEGNKIEAVGSLDSISHSGVDEKIDAQDGFILPGLIDTHVHLMMEGIDIMKVLTTPFSLNFYQAIGYMKKTLQAGITTVRDAGGSDLGTKRAVEQGLVAGPRMQISISILTMTGGHADFWLHSGNEIELFKVHPGRPNGRCDGLEEVRQKVREVLRAGADVIKVCSTGGVASPTDHPEFTQFTQEELEVMVQEGACRKGIKVMSHAQGTEGIKTAIRAGIHSIEHGIYLDDEAIELMLERGTFLVPTLLAPIAVLEGAKSSENMPTWAAQKAEEVVDAHKKSIAKAHKAGIKIAMGTDAGVVPHGTNLRELGLMCDIGMTPMEALIATTKTAAECLGWDSQLGTVEQGKLADIVIVKTDPLADIRSLENADNIVAVIKDGQVVR